MNSAKQEVFCQALLNGRSQSDAYCCAYNTRPDWTAGAIAVSASRLMKDPKINKRIAELRDASAKTAYWSRHQSVQPLKGVVLSD